MLKAVSFSIHDLVRFGVFDNKRFFRSYITQYKHFLGECNDHDFTIYIGKFEPDLDNCFILDDRYYVRDNYFYCSDSRKVSKWKLELKGLENDKLQIKIDTNFFGRFSSIVNIIDYLLHYTLNEKGCPILHSSGVCKDGNAFLFAGRSGGGKTSLATYFMEKGFDYLGDNFIILNKGHAYSFISPLNIFTYNITPLVEKNLGKKKVPLTLKSLLYKLTGGYIKIFTKLDITDVLKEKIQKRAKIDTVFLILPRKEFQVREIELDEMVEHLVFNQKLEFLHMPFLNYISTYSYVYPESRIAGQWVKYKNNLMLNLKNKKLYKVEVPIKYNDKIIDEIYKLID